MKTTEDILWKNIPDKIKNEGFSYGDVDEKYILKAMREHTIQFIDLAIKRANDNPQDSSINKYDLEDIKKLVK